MGGKYHQVYPLSLIHILGTLFLVVSGLTVLSCLVEGCIREVRKAAEEAYTFRQYRSDIREGFAFLKREKGIRNIYTYMSITQGASSGVEVLTQAYYQTQPWPVSDTHRWSRWSRQRAYFRRLMYMAPRL